MNVREALHDGVRYALILFVSGTFTRISRGDENGVAWQKKNEQRYIVMELATSIPKYMGILPERVGGEDLLPVSARLSK